MNTAIIVVLILVVVGIVAAVVLLGGGGGGAPPAEQTTPTPSGDDTPTQPADTPTQPIALGDLGIDFNAPYECTATFTDPNIGTMVSLIKAELPKMRTEASAPQGDSIMLTSDGITLYIYDATMDHWLMIVADEGDDGTYEVTEPGEMEDMYMEPPAGYTIDCKNVADIPDSEFQLPPGAEVVDLEKQMEDALEGLEGLGGGSGDLDYWKGL